MAKKRRIYQIAKELNISHEEILQFLETQDVNVNSHMSRVDEGVYEKILNEFAKEKVIVDRYRKEKERQQIEEERRQQEKEEAEQKKQEEEERRLEEARQKIEEEERKRKEIEEENRRRIKKSRKKDEEAERKRRIEEEARQQLEKEEEERRKKKEAEEKKKREKEKAKDGEDEEQKDEEKKKKTRTVEIADLEGRISGRKKKKKKKEEKKSKKKSKKEQQVEEKVKKTLASLDEKSGGKKHRKKKDEEETEVEDENVIKVAEYVSVDDLASQMDVDPSDVVAKCMELGMMVTINQRLDMDTIIMVADEFGFDVEQEKEYGEELLLEDETEEDLEHAEPRPPVITIMGHVDHGKTTLLDYIRSANVVAGESGGITQHIGAYNVELDSGKQITFLDTPGHEAFTAMRARGAQITDIVILIVAADDAVMPQTVEAINHSKAAGVPIVVAINKIDRPEADVDRVKRELSEQGILVEDWGGKYQAVELSAKTGEGVDELLESLVLESDLLELKANPDRHARGVVVESNLDKGLGAVATVLVDKGTLKVGDNFVCGVHAGRVRAMHDERGNEVEEAGPSQPVRVLGFDDVPQAGDTFVVLEEEREAKKISAERQKQRREQELRLNKLTTLDEISQQIKEGKVKELSVVIKGDADGSIEAISDSLQNLGTGEVAVNVVHRGVGMISESDVLLAVASDAVIIGFHVSTAPQAVSLAKEENIEIRNYKVIYDAVNDIRLALEGMLEPEEREKTIGRLEVRDLFKVPRAGMVAGCYVSEGKITRDARARVHRNNEVIFDGEVATLKRFKDDVKEVAEGYECGVSLEGYDDVEIDDEIEAYEIVTVKRTLEQSAEAS
ncbi:MAG: translation initiation factor IF-2 [Candidatus Marinimicrobia bacterium]|nr:translation initiation factor IF-2 [Candidatus Neomarinimicrobiota bacterium]MCF7880624.1 translation initiation factor IF-2 [Candidatus Neomarinimicrobiota bacterium]